MARRNVFELSQALKFFADSGFLSIVRDSSTELPLHYQYKPNGGLLLRNFIHEWFICNVAVKEKVSLISAPLLTDKQIPRVSLSSGTLQCYNDLLNTYDGKLPFGVASNGSCVDACSELGVFSMKRPHEFTECLVQYFVSEKSMTDVLHRMEIDHLLWWKQMSNTKDFTPIRREGEGISSHIVYSSCHGDTTVESVSVTGPHTELVNSPCIIESRISVDVALMVLLHDAYSEHLDDDNQLHQKMKFHQRLAPYKLGIMFDSGSSDDLNLVADYIKEELRKETILIQTNYNSSNDNRLQRMGIPYAVLLTNSTLVDGKVYLQDMYASIKEEVHVTKLKEKIVKYVKS